MSQVPASLIVYPGCSHRRPVLERITRYLKSEGLKVIVCALSMGAVNDARRWADDIVDHWTWGDSADMVLESLSTWEIRLCFSYDDFGVEFAAAIAEKLRLRTTPLAVVRTVQNKASFRSVCNSKGAFPTGSWQVFCVDDLAQVHGQYPKVLKPTRGAGSYWCRKVLCYEELVAAYTTLAPQLASASFFLHNQKAAGFVVEDYVGGHEFDVDGVVVNGRFEFACVSDNDPALEPDFLETGGHYPSTLPEKSVQRILDVAASIVAEWPQLTSVVHFEGKLLGNDVFPLEMNIRLGGAEACACVCSATGVDLAVLVPMVALEDLDAVRLQLASVTKGPKKCARSVNIQLDSSCRFVAQCGPRPGTPGPIAVANFIGAQYYLQVGNSYGGTGSQRTVAWVAAAGDSHDDAERALTECLAFCEFRGTMDNPRELD